MWSFRRRPHADASPQPAAATQPPQPRLLVCDDNDTVTQLLELMFTQEGWVVETVSNGEACLDVLERRRPDVLVVDEQMAGISGLTTAKLARKRGFDRPILLFSAYLDDKAQSQAKRLDVLPVSKLDFPNVVRHVTAAHGRHRRAQVRLRADQRR